jgi:hypothetical protein
MKNKDIIKSIKKFRPKKGDIFIVRTAPYGMSDVSKQQIAEAIQEIGKDIPCLFLHGFEKPSYARFEKPEQGKHKVYLNNLEYLEYLSKKGE